MILFLPHHDSHALHRYIPSVKDDSTPHSSQPTTPTTSEPMGPPPPTSNFAIPRQPEPSFMRPTQQYAARNQLPADPYASMPGTPRPGKAGCCRMMLVL